MLVVFTSRHKFRYRAADERWIDASGEHLPPRRAPRSTGELFGDTHYERLMLDGFERDNVRGLIDLAERIVRRIASGAGPQATVAEIFTERFAKDVAPPSEPEIDTQGRTTMDFKLPEILTASEYDMLERAYSEHGGNVTAIRDCFREWGVEISRKRIARALDDLGWKRARLRREET